MLWEDPLVPVTVPLLDEPLMPMLVVPTKPPTTAKPVTVPCAEDAVMVLLPAALVPPTNRRFDYLLR